MRSLCIPEKIALNDFYRNFRRETEIKFNRRPQLFLLVDMSLTDTVAWLMDN